MARVSTIWPTIMVAMVLSLLLLFYFSSDPLQEKLGKLYCFTSRGTHYLNKFKLPRIPERFYLLWPSSHTLLNDDQGLLNDDEVKISAERENHNVIEAAEESLEKTKLMMEDSAKTAAEMVGDAVHKTVDMVKETFSKPTTLSSHGHQDEL